MKNYKQLLLAGVLAFSLAAQTFSMPLPVQAAQQLAGHAEMARKEFRTELQERARTDPADGQRTGRRMTGQPV